MALHSPYCADVPLGNCSLTHCHWTIFQNLLNISCGQFQRLLMFLHC